MLPATSQIEHLDLSPAWGHLYLALNRPAIAPRGESVSNTELFRRLARALGRTEPWLFESDESMLRAALASGHPWLDGITYERLWEEGLRAAELPGGLAAVRRGRLRDAVGKAELYSESLREQGHDPLPWRARSGRRRPAADHRQGAPLPELRLQQHGAAPPARRRAVHRDPSRGRARAEAWRAATRCACGTSAARCAPCARCPTASARASHGCRSAGSSDAGGTRRAVNVLTAEEPTDWGGGSGFYDAFVEVAPAEPHPQA